MATKADKRGRENWVSDASVSNCQGCKASFSLFTRRHHCRACGNVFCKSCTSFEIGLHRDHYKEGVEKQKRVCAWCFKTLTGERHSPAVRVALVPPGAGHENESTSTGLESEDEMFGALSSLRLKASHDDEDSRSEPPSPAAARAAGKASPSHDSPRPEHAVPRVVITPVDASPAKASDERPAPAAAAPVATPRSGAPSEASSDEEPGDAARAPARRQAASRADGFAELQPGDMSEFSGPQWEAFSQAHPAAADAFRGCAEAVSDPKAWDNKAELTMKALRLHVLRLPQEALGEAPGRGQVLLFVKRLEDRRPLYRRQTAEIREKITGTLSPRVC